MHRPIAVEEEIDRQINHVRDVMNLDESRGGDQHGRQILEIRNARYHTSGYLPDRGAGATSQAYIVFQGTPTPSSDVTGGVIRFVGSDDLRMPYFDEASKIIHLWVDRAYLRMVIEQLKHRKQYLWIGFFGEGHTYGDLHSDP